MDIMSVQGNIVVGHGIEVRSAMAEARTRDASKRKPVRQRGDLAADPCIAKLPVSTHRWILSFVGSIDTPDTPFKVDTEPASSSTPLSLTA
jgi:hypothetical protein